jgi:hypothetical protein
MDGTTFRKVWRPVFSTTRYIVDQELYVQGLKDIHGADGDELGLFFEEYPGPVPSFQDQVVREFCNGILASSLRISAEKGPTDIAKAWLEDREYCRCQSSQIDPTQSSAADNTLDIGDHTNSHARPYPTRITAGQLAFHLMAKVMQASVSVNVMPTNSHSDLIPQLFQTQIADWCK